MRWQRYVRGSGAGCADLWRAARAASAGQTVVLGAGFDPRTPLALQAYLEACEPPTQVLLIELPEYPEHANTSELAARNLQRVEELAAAASAPLNRVRYPTGADRRSAGLAISRELQQRHIPDDHGVLVDISAIPTHLYFPILGGLLERRDEIQLQVVVAENPLLDSVIEEEGASDPGPISGFAHGLTRETGDQQVRVWCPVLGEGHGSQLTQLHEYLSPDEVCPVLPFPARDPRRADALVVEHRQLLFDTIAVEPTNFVYADERNPFDLYRALTQLRLRYADALAPLGGALVITSVHASKLLSVGALMASWEGESPVVASTPTGYALAESGDLAQIVEDTTLECLWLSGEPYLP